MKGEILSCLSKSWEARSFMLPAVSYQGGFSHLSLIQGQPSSHSYVCNSILVCFIFFKSIQMLVYMNLFLKIDFQNYRFDLIV